MILALKDTVLGPSYHSMSLGSAEGTLLRTYTAAGTPGCERKDVCMCVCVCERIGRRVTLGCMTE